MTALLSVGCESVPEITPVPDRQEAYAARAARLADLAGWAVAGRLALSSPDDSSTVSVRWTQTGDAYHIRLSALLGQGLVEIEGEPGAVTMRTSDERTVVAANAQALLAREAGLAIPVEGLRYWVLGLPEPDVLVDRLTFDAAGRPTELEQSGWTIRYLRWAPSDGLDMPTKVFMDSGGLSARLAVSRWDLGT